MNVNTQIDLISKNDLYNFYRNGQMSHSDMIKLINALKNNTTLVSFGLCFCDNIGDELFDLIDVLSTNESLEYLNFSYNEAGDECVVKICNAFQHHKVFNLDITSNLISQNGIDALANLLDKNKNIKELTFGEENLYHLNVSPIFNSLNDNTTLKSLSICNGILNNSDVDKLTSMLRKNKKPSVLTLRISRSYPYDECYLLHKLATILNENVNTKSLILFGPTDDDVHIISDALTHNTKLKKLVLASGSVTNTGALRLVELLKVNTTLKDLGLFNNNIEIEGIVALCGQYSLTSLDVSDNDNISPHISSLSDALCKNTSLVVINVYHPDIDKCSWDNFIDAIQENYIVTNFFCYLNSFTDKTIKFLQRNQENANQMRFVRAKPVID